MGTVTYIEDYLKGKTKPKLRLKELIERATIPDDISMAEYMANYYVHFSDDDMGEKIDG